MSMLNLTESVEREMQVTVFPYVPNVVVCIKHKLVMTSEDVEDCCDLGCDNCEAIKKAVSLN